MNETEGMMKMFFLKREIEKIVKDRTFPRLLFACFTHTGITNILSDKTHVCLAFRVITGKKLNLSNPHTFREKLQWLKLYDRNPLYSIMVDKYEVKKYVEDKGYSHYVIPTIGVWESVSEIDFSNLPKSFVLKCTHDSGSVVICRDKKDFKGNVAQKKLRKGIKRNFYYNGREWPYKNVKPRIIAEPYLAELGGNVIEYKIFCFGGEPYIILVCTGDAHTNKRKHSWFDTKFKKLPFKIGASYLQGDKIQKPDNLQEMLEFAKEMSQGIPQVRVDLYNVEGQIYFGEFTFFHESGYKAFFPEDWDEKIGELIKLPKTGKNTKFN